MKAYKKGIAYLLILIPLITFFYLFFRYTINAPINDDYSILDFLNKCISTDSVTEKVKLLFAQHNEHRIVYDKIWTVISYKVNKNVNFNLLSLVGNLSLVAISIVFFRKFLRTGNSLLLFIPITALIFNITSWENITFPMATMSNFTVCFFIIISINYLTKDLLSTKNLFIAVLFFLFAVFTQGGGLFLFPLSVLILLFRKEYKNLSIYLIATIPILVLYFYNYFNPTGNLDIKNILVTHNYKIIVFAFAFLGNAFNYALLFTENNEQSIYIGAFVGFLLFLLFLYATLTKYYNKNLFNYSLMLFFILSSFATAISRISYGIDTAGASRYRINGILFAVAVYFWVLETYPVQKRKYSITIITCSILYFCFINVIHYENLNIREKQTYLGILLFNEGNPKYLNGDKNQLALYKDILDRAVILDTYHFPTNEEIVNYFPYSNSHKETKDLEISALNSTSGLDSIISLEDSYLLDGWAFLEGKSTKKQKLFIGLTNEKDKTPTFYYTKQIPRYDLNPYFGKHNLEDGGYLARIRKNDVGIGINKVSILIETDGIKKIIETNKTIVKEL